MKMSKVQMLRALVNQRQTAAAEEVFELFERTIAEYRAVCFSREGNDRQRKLLDADLTTTLRSEVQQVIVGEQLPSEQQEWSLSVYHVDPEPPHIKEEQEELWSSQWGEQLQRPVPVKSEDDEESAQSSQLHQRQTDEQIHAEADGEVCEGSEPARKLRVLVKQRLTAAVEEIFGLFETALAEYREKIDGLHKLLEEAVKLEVPINTADVPHLLVIKEEVPSEQQEWRTSVDQEELWSSQEEEQLQGLEEDDATKFPFTIVAVKSGDDEGKAQSSHLHQRQADEQMDTGADGEDCGGSEPARTFGPACDLHEGSDEKTHSSDHDTENSDDCSQEMSQPQSGLVTLNYNEDYISHKGSNPVEKLSCGKTVNNIPNMSVDTGGKPFSCSICGKGFSEKCGLKRRIRFHTGEKPFFCIFCEKNFTEKADLKRHMRVHTGEKPFSCPICGKGFSEKTDMTRHIRVHTGEKPFSCSICGKIFSQNENLRRHERIHTGEKPFSCLVCTKKFTHRGALVVHMRIHTGEKPFGCTVCGKRYIETGNLKKHMRVHTGEKPFTCPICGKGFSEKTDMTRHIRVHTGEKPFSCSICGKIFSQNENLRRHERIHTGEKPFSCPVCTKKFTHRGALVVHMRIHTGEKPFGCTVCGKRYIETGNLKKHMRVHTGEKPFSCSVCGRRFNYQSQVKNHKCSGESSIPIVHHS